LVERATDDNGVLTGYTENYLRTAVDVPERFVGRIIPVRLTGLDGEVMTSELLDYEEQGATARRLTLLS